MSRTNRTTSSSIRISSRSARRSSRWAWNMSSAGRRRLAFATPASGWTTPCGGGMTNTCCESKGRPVALPPSFGRRSVEHAGCVLSKPAFRCCSIFLPEMPDGNTRRRRDSSDRWSHDRQPLRRPSHHTDSRLPPRTAHRSILIRRQGLRRSGGGLPASESIATHKALPTDAPNE